MGGPRFGIEPAKFLRPFSRKSKDRLERVTVSQWGVVHAFRVELYAVTFRLEPTPEAAFEVSNTGVEAPKINFPVPWGLFGRARCIFFVSTNQVVASIEPDETLEILSVFGLSFFLLSVGRILGVSRISHDKAQFYKETSK